MSAPEVYAPYGVRYETDGMSPTPALCGGVTRQSVATNTEDSQEAMAGSAYPMHLSLTAQKVVGSFTTRNIGLIIANCLPPCDILAGDGVQFYQVKKTDGQIDAGSVHRCTNIADGIIVPRRLSLPADGHGEIEYEVISRWDGTNDPLIFTETSALPAETLEDPDRWALGTLDIGGIDVDGKLNLEIEFGVTAEQIGTDGDVWNKYIDVPDYLARVTLGSIDTDIVADAGIPLAGKAGTHLNTIGYIRKRDGGGFASGAVHLKYTIDGLAYADNVYDADGNKRGECNLVLMARYDGTNAPIVFTASQALP